jgi:hypothetical protein
VFTSNSSGRVSVREGQSAYYLEKMRYPSTRSVPGYASEVVGDGRFHRGRRRQSAQTSKGLKERYEGEIATRANWTPAISRPDAFRRIRRGWPGSNPAIPVTLRAKGCRVPAKVSAGPTMRSSETVYVVAASMPHASALAKMALHHLSPCSEAFSRLAPESMEASAYQTASP